jgi:hypothetical protein
MGIFDYAFPVDRYLRFLSEGMQKHANCQSKHLWMVNYGGCKFNSSFWISTKPPVTGTSWATSPRYSTGNSTSGE